MNNKDQKMIAGRVDAEIKDLFAKEAEQRGISQQELLQEALQEFINRDGTDNIPSPSIEEEIPPVDLEQYSKIDKNPELASKDEAAIEEEGEEEIEEDVSQNVYDLFTPLLAEELNCAIVEAWRKTDKEEALQPVSDLLLDLADDLEEKAFTSRKYECKEDDYTEVLSEEAIEEIEQILTDAKAELGQTVDKETIFRTIAQFSYQRSDTIYEEGRAVKLVFKRPDWVALDKVIKQANLERTEGTELDLEKLIRIKLGEIMEDIGTGLFGTKDQQLYEVSQVFQNVG